MEKQDIKPECCLSVTISPALLYFYTNAAETLNMQNTRFIMWLFVAVISDYYVIDDKWGEKMTKYMASLLLSRKSLACCWYVPQSANTLSEFTCHDCSDLWITLIIWLTVLHFYSPPSFTPQTNHLHLLCLRKQRQTFCASVWRRLISHNYGLGTSLFDYFDFRLFCRCRISNQWRAKPGPASK